MMVFEIVIVSLVRLPLPLRSDDSIDRLCQVLCVFISFMILLHLVQPDWAETFYGFVPSSVSDLSPA